jgi:hypothetical protein
MKKIISIDSIEAAFVLSIDGVVIITIPRQDLTVDGKQLFENLFSKIDITNKVFFTYNVNASITEPNDKRIVKDIQEILDGIANKINDKFKLLTDEIDEFLENGIVGKVSS